jgi:hypothetical protein
MKNKILFCTLLALSLQTLGQEIVTASSEDIKEFDKVLSKSSKPANGKKTTGTKSGKNKKSSDGSSDDLRSLFNSRPGMSGGGSGGPGGGMPPRPDPGSMGMMPPPPAPPPMPPPPGAPGPKPPGQGH